MAWGLSLTVVKGLIRTGELRSFQGRSPRPDPSRKRRGFRAPQARRGRELAVGAHLGAIPEPSHRHAPDAAMAALPAGHHQTFTTTTSSATTEGRRHGP